MALNAWIEEDYDLQGHLLGTYSVYGDEQTWRYERRLSLLEAWKLARSLDPNASIKRWTIRKRG